MLSAAKRRCQGLHLTLEAALPSPSILFIGSPVPLRLFVQRRETADGAPAKIQSLSLTISIRTETAVTAGSHKNTWVTVRELVRVPVVELPFGADVPEALTEISNGPWKDTPLADLTPSFTTCTIHHQHSLLVTAEFDYGHGKAVDV